ncbi:MAG TPA: magnesium/cobalt transporter CorA [Ignavibacteriales bacterium]|nr:magnesium/cobalt transporter CorA [Ignavibacteriales bacterium]
MKKILKNSRKKAGQLPGSLIYMGDRTGNGIKIIVAEYDSNNFSEKQLGSPGEIKPEGDKNFWINVDGIHKADVIGAIGEKFSIHPLTMEDILNTSHRPKAEDNGNYMFIVMKMLSSDAKTGTLKSEQVSLIIGKNYVISFQEDAFDEFETVRDNLRKNKGRARELGPDYLAYRLLDVVLDNYFSVLETVGDNIEIIEDELVANPTKQTLEKIYRLKGDMILIRRAVWPLREVIGSLEKTESDLIAKTSRPYLRDLYDHAVQLIDTNENYREMTSGLMDIYLSSVSNKLNEIMKVLTIISTFFIPLNFIAGLYGMNFNSSVSKFNMPELNFYLGYPMVLSLMLLVVLGLFVYFKRKKWF